MEFTPNEAIVRSAGISLAPLGLLGNAPQPREEIRQFEFRFPTHPQPETGIHAHVPIEYGGAFINGVPVFNQFEAASYLGQNLWHYDQVARAKKGTPTHAPQADGLIEKLIPVQGEHSPIIGFALDGYPIYGPWASTTDGLRRMRSSYQLRKIATRDTWPDATRLAPGQEGPVVSSEYPLGTFVEDYEYVEGSGDLDQYNGRFSITPGYPQGTYAYFLSTSQDGRLAFPYLLAHQFYGKLGNSESSSSQEVISFKKHNDTLEFQVFDNRGNAIRHLEFVHERPMHLMVVSRDLSEFAHIHPEVDEYGIWRVKYVFPSSGNYRLYAQFTPPGSNQRMEHFDVVIPGKSRPMEVLKPTPQTSLSSEGPLTAGTDLELRFKPPTIGLQPYLGAWAHVMIAGKGLSSFSHAHPLDDAANAIQRGEAHNHLTKTQGPPPTLIRIPANFPTPGIYKIWVQMQVSGKVETLPFVVTVGQSPNAAKKIRIPKDAIQIKITSDGFYPTRIMIPAGKPVMLAFIRSSQPNCGNQVVFPQLGLKQITPLGGVALMMLPATEVGEIRFTCGMGMYRGSIVAVTPQQKSIP